MLLSRVKNSHRVIALLVLMIASLFGLLLLPPIPQEGRGRPAALTNARARKIIATATRR